MFHEWKPFFKKKMQLFHVLDLLYVKFLYKIWIGYSSILIVVEFLETYMIHYRESGRRRENTERHPSSVIWTLSQKKNDFGSLQTLYNLLPYMSTSPQEFPPFLPSQHAFNGSENVETPAQVKHVYVTNLHSWTIH